MSILPEWDDELPCIAGPLVFDDKVNEAGGYVLNDFSAEHLNRAAEFAFVRSRFLCELAGYGQSVTLTPDELTRLADDFGAIGFHVGDGVLFDAEMTPLPTKRRDEGC